MRTALLSLTFLLAGSMAAPAFAHTAAPKKKVTATTKKGKILPMKEYIDQLMAKMTLQEKIGQLNLMVAGDITTGGALDTQVGSDIAQGNMGGVFNIKGLDKIKALQEIAIKNSRLGIPLLVGMDVIHGYETMFPIPLALSCSWDTEAMKKVGVVSAKEASADGINWSFSPMVDIALDARWGRISEGNGEDPYLSGVMLLNSSPELRADALYLIADGDTVSVLDGTTDIPQERVIVTGAQSGDAEVTLPAGEKVTVTHGDDIEYATTRNGERVSELLRRLQISVSPLEMVLVDVTEEEVEITVASDFTYYETATEAAPHTTLTSTSYRIPKGETQVVQQGIDGTRDIVYEVVYADGQFVSRQAVEEKNDTSVAEITYTGTLVDKAQSGDTVKSVVTESDGSGYLLMKSGDSVHFSGSMKVTCTAYTAGYGGVGTRTATGTTVHVGTVAVDKKVIPLGTEMFIVGSSGYTYGNAVAEDTGVRGAAIDLYMNSYQECKQFGRQKNSTVYFLD